MPLPRDPRPRGVSTASQPTTCRLSRPTLDVLHELKRRTGMGLDAIIYDKLPSWFQFLANKDAKIYKHQISRMSEWMPKRKWMKTFGPFITKNRYKEEEEDIKWSRSYIPDGSKN